MRDRIQIVKGDITTLEVDAIVNAANESLLGGGGVDGAIHAAAGPELLKVCEGLGGCKPGEAKVTMGYNLPAKFIIHTVGPIWMDGNMDESTVLASCYRNSLSLAVEKSIETIAFPSISTGAYGYPFEKAASVALSTVKLFLDSEEKIKKVIFVLHSEIDFNTYKQIFNKL